MRFTEVVQLLKDTGNQVVVLKARKSPSAVVVAPGLVGRAMCSSFDQNLGLANAWINEGAVRKGKVDPVFNNFGGEERFWFAPEGGPFGLMFGKEESRFENYSVQQGMSTLEYKVVTQDDQSVLMVAELSLENASGTRFDLRVERRISLLESCPYVHDVPGAVEIAAFQSENCVTNLGDRRWTRDRGTVAMWCLGQFLEHPRQSIIIPVRPGWDARHSPPTVDEYFKDFCLGGSFPPNRRVNFDDFVLLKADGKVRGKVGVKKQRALGKLGSYDPDTSHLVIVDHDFYPESDYPTGYWRNYDDAFSGDALSVYIDGPERSGGAQGLSYELETMSPALFLRPGESFNCRNRTFNVRGEPSDIGLICHRYLKARLDQVEEFERNAG